MDFHKVSTSSGRIAIFLPTLEGGGAERVMVTLINGFCRRGFEVDVLLARALGPFIAQLAPEARVIDLGVPRVMFALMPLVRYLRDTRPAALLSAMDHCNVIAILAKKLSGVNTRVVVSVHSNFSVNNAQSGSIRAKLTRYWAGPFYHFAEKIVAVSGGVADDLARSIRLKSQRIKVIYNPVVTPSLSRLAEVPVQDVWGLAANVPLILAVGRLTAAKDFGTLLQAFAKIRACQPASLLILGEGEERDNLERAIDNLNIAADVRLPGFVENPYRFMRIASVFVLSSRWEGFGNVLAEALACGTTVISTDCPSGPAEILENGRWGTLVPVGDVDALAVAMLSRIAAGRQEDAVASSVARFGEDGIVDQYLATVIS